jgi:hypothetical protein
MLGHLSSEKARRGRLNHPLAEESGASGSRCDVVGRVRASSGLDWTRKIHQGTLLVLRCGWSSAALVPDPAG